MHNFVELGKIQFHISLFIDTCINLYNRQVKYHDAFVNRWVVPHDLKKQINQFAGKIIHVALLKFVYCRKCFSSEFCGPWGW